MQALVTGFEPFGGEPSTPRSKRCASAAAARRAGARDAVLPACSGGRSTALETAVGRPPRTSSCASAWPAAAPHCRSNGWRSTSTMPASRTTRAGSRSTGRWWPAGRGLFRDIADQGRGGGVARGGLPAIVSNSAGTFVCNHVFYGLMHLAATRGIGVARRLSACALSAEPGRAAAAGAPSMALDDIVRGIEIVLSVAAARHDDIAAAEGVIS